ncbi:hypothetical protein C8R48DRAFT_136474 [Suillus tomentosus]|nr:hypothetical protein C8R48DRAFT_136474 [Suillus tomentosus]
MRSSRVEINPIASSQAAALDDERNDKGGCGPLHRIPLSLKNSVVTLHKGMDTIAGTFCATAFHFADHSFRDYPGFLRPAGFCRSLACI